MQSMRRIFDAQPNAENSAHRVNCDSVRQGLLWLLDDDGPAFEGLCSGESGEEVTWNVHFDTKYATGFEVKQLFFK
jgi:hypothetical protein